MSCVPSAVPLMLAGMERGLLGRRPLLMTRDESIIDAVQRLAAAAGIDADVDAVGRGSWSTAPLVLIGTDVTADLAAMHLPRRPGVIVVGVGALPTAPGPGSVDRQKPDGIWREALALGAEHVIVLPEADAWLVQRLGETADGPTRTGRLVAVVGASGGCGASTIATALAIAAAGSVGRTLLIDGAPDGGGLDLVLGAESVPGIRWPDLSDAKGRLSSRTLDQALPHPHGIALLSHARPLADAPDSDVTASVLDAARRGYDLVLVDLEERRSAFATHVLEHADTVIVVVAASVRGIAAGLGAIEALSMLPGRVVIALRLLAKGIGAQDARLALGPREHVVVPDSPAVGQRANAGDAELPKDAFGRAVHAIRDALAPVGALVA